MIRKTANIWWGPPRKFSTILEERKISWLELFYDLVYVIVISKATHHLAQHPGWDGLKDYLYILIMIYWGWVNGSLYYDLHGSPGIRTRFMTLWQMVAVAALAVAIDSPADKIIFRGTIALAILQTYITYLWWSVGIYDKHHRKLNRPYTFCYIAAFVTIIATLVVPAHFQRLLFWLTLILNYMPPFLGARVFRQSNDDFSLSSSMMERMGLITIIVFGEAILGVIGGVSGMEEMNALIWINFGLGILVVFMLWWIFFALMADRESKKGFLTGQFMLILFIPVLASLGMTGASFPGVIESLASADTDYLLIERVLFGSGIAVFLWSITAVSAFLEYPKDYDGARAILQPSLLFSGFAILILTWLLRHFPVIDYLVSVLLILFAIVFVITKKWFVVQLRQMERDVE
ncbi:MAG: low temperature requirement protein A [Saprospiraceae bacterium]